MITLFKGYTKREVKQADKAELLSVARAMNDDFEPKVRKLFSAEVQAADHAIQTGINSEFSATLKPVFKIFLLKRL